MKHEPGLRGKSVVELDNRRTEISRHYVQLGKAVLERFRVELETNPDGLSYDRESDTDVLQIGNPVLGGASEQFLIEMVRYDKRLSLRQLYYSQAGRVWMEGFSCDFEIDDLKTKDGEFTFGGLEDSVEVVLADEGVVEGMIGAVLRWPTVEYRVEVLGD